MEAKANQNMQNALLAGGAAGSVVIPQALTQAFPQIFAQAAPIASQTLPLCTGVCGSCGATCIGSVFVALWLGGTAYVKSKNVEE